MSVRARLARELDPALRTAPGLSPTNWAVCALIGAAMLLAVLRIARLGRFSRATDTEADALPQNDPDQPSR